MPREFQGKIELDVRDSKPDWTPFLGQRAPKDAPNVLPKTDRNTQRLIPIRPFGRIGPWCPMRRSPVVDAALLTGSKTGIDRSYAAVIERSLATI
jgi:hypothetical protein